MFYLIDTHGTTTAVYTEPIYQGSVGVNNVVLFAPFPANAQVTMYARLPNGISLRNPYVLTAQAYPYGAPVLRDEYGNAFTSFIGTIHESITEFPGIVEVQFKVIEGVGRVLGTYTTSFNVTEGVITDPITIPTDEDYLNAVLQYLAELNSDPLKSVIYKAGNALATPDTISAYPSTHVDTSRGATTKYIYGEVQGAFINAPPTGGVGIQVDLNYETPIFAQLLQFWMESPTVEPIKIYVNAALNGNIVASTELSINNTAGSVSINPRAYLGSVNVDLIQIEILSPQDNVYIKGVQVFKQNVDGEYVFTLKSGAQAIINAPDGKTIESYFERASNEADRAKAEADRASDEVERASNEADRAASWASSALSYSNSANVSASNAFTEANRAKAEAENSQIYANQALSHENNASQSAAQAEASAREAYEALQNILGRRNTFYEATMKLALGAILSNSYILAPGDLFVIGEKGVPELLVFPANDEAIATTTEIITQAQIIAGTFNVVPGGRYKLENANGVIQWGVVAIESGFDPTNLVTIQQFDNAISNLDRVKQNKLQTTPLTIIGVDGTGVIINYKIARDVPGIETDLGSIVNTSVLGQALGDIQTALTNIIVLQNSYINGGNT